MRYFTKISLGVQAFQSCTNLKYVTLPANYVGCTASTSYNYNNIFHMSGIEKMLFPKSVVGIPYGFLRNCQSLEYVEIEENVNFIGENAFSGCPKLITTIIHALTPPTLQNGNFNYNTNIIYVPDESVEAYRAATNWSVLSSRIKPMSEFVEK